MPKSPAFRLAQVNIARARYALDDPRIVDFMNKLDEINALADQAPGFVWRLKDDSGNATGFARDGDPRRILNLSVWESVESLKAFTYGDGHVEFIRRRLEWFEPRDGAHLVLWWVPAGHEPSIDEAESRLARLEADGPGAGAFTFAHPYPPDAEPPR
jgi:hypothetical protein